MSVSPPYPLYAHVLTQRALPSLNPPAATTTYGAVTSTIHYLADRSAQPRPTFSDVMYAFPLTHAEILERFRAKLREVKQQHTGARFSDVPPLSPGHDTAVRGRGNKIVAVIDAIVAVPGVLLPWKEMVRVAREEGVWTVIDAAHSIGQEVRDSHFGEWAWACMDIEDECSCSTALT